LTLSVKHIFRFLLEAICSVLMAVGFLAALVASFFIIGVVAIWCQEGALQDTDRKMFVSAAEWLAASSLLAGTILWLRHRFIVNKSGDAGFRLVKSLSRQEERLVQQISDKFLIALLAMWLWVVVPGNAFIKISITAGWVLVAFLGLHVWILAHELGHLVAAWILGLNLQKIQVGVGDLLWGRTLSTGLRCEWRASPRRGLVIATQRHSAGFRVRQWLFVAGGPLVDAFVVWSGYIFLTRVFGQLGAAFRDGANGVTLSALFCLIALSAIGNLVPHTVWLGNQKVWTDGYWLFRLLTTSRERIEELIFNDYYKTTLELLRTVHAQGSRPAKAVPNTPKQSGPHPVSTFRDQKARLASRLRPGVDR
jgi:hypothetical protein